MALFDPARVMQAQIDSGYRGTDYAIAEIIDNSIEAKAENIDVYLIEKIKGSQRKVWRINEIVIVDNGTGMPEDVLGNVLTFGFGTHENEIETTKKGYGQLGKYGFGLPNSSVSQANDIQVWSWQDGIANSLHSSLDVNHILRRVASEQTPATRKNIPSRLLHILKTRRFPIKQSGTLVYWNDTERCSWTVGKSLIKHLEATVGRIFRHFINNDNIQIRIFLLRENELDNPQYECLLKPNDPLFLMPDSLAHELVEQKDRNVNESLFEPYPTERPEQFDIPVSYKGKDCVVKLRFSMTKRKFRARPYGGASSFGKLAKDNEGFSICREGRELQLSKNWSEADTRERWWGAEVDFPRELDGIFGVTNNKQAATKLEEMAKIDIDAFLAEYEGQTNDLNRFELTEASLSYRQMINEMKDNDDMRWVLLEIASTFQEQIRRLRLDIRKMPEEAPPQDKANGNQPGANSGDSGFGKGVNPITSVIHKPETTPTEGEIDNTVHILVDELEDNNPDTFEQLKTWLSNNEENVLFKVRDLDSSNFFSCRQDYGKFLITLNEGHPAFETLFQVIQDIASEGDSQAQLSKEQMVDKIDGIRVCLALMLYAWAEAENDESLENKKLARRLRETWGVRLESLLAEYKKQMN